jgi:hypothetical protein
VGSMGRQKDQIDLVAEVLPHEIGSYVTIIAV